MSEVTYDKAEIARTAKRNKAQAEAKRIEDARNNLQSVPQEHVYPRSEVKQLSDGMYEFIYIDPNTMVSRRVESTKHAKQSGNKSESGAGGNGVSDA